MTCQMYVDSPKMRIASVPSIMGNTTESSICTKPIDLRTV